MKFSRENFTVLSKLVDDLQRLPKEQRQDYIDALSGCDDETKTLLSDLLSHYTPGGDVTGSQFSGAGYILGPYRLLRKIGRGGMGTVWLAERADGVLKRRIALKLPHLDGRMGGEILDRFDRERDILAALTHRHIARLYDAGVCESQPYLALEYVEGVNLTEYCDRLQLAVEARLQLFLQVLSAVQYAHSHLVIHRDLKPTNILVTSDGEVKLLDFGIAKLLFVDEPAPDLTRTGNRLLTPNYASPEQIAGDTVSTASDIYALGVVLYELLTGCRPYRLKRETGAALEEAILQTAPVPPSEATVSLAGAEARSATTSNLSAYLKGDLDAIVLKALKKMPAERYATADALGMDIKRYLAGEAVLAQPDSRWYRTRKFILRHRVPLGAAAAVGLVLTVALVLAFWQFHVAQVRARQAAAVSTFLEDIFRANSNQQSDPLRAQRTTARELLDIGARKIDQQLNDAPAAKLQVLSTLEDMYSDLGLSDQAVTLGRRSVDLSRHVNGGHDLATVNALLSLSSAMHASRSVNQREKILLEAKQILDDKRDFKSTYRARLDSILAEHYESTDVSKALEYARKAVTLYRDSPASKRALTEALYTECLAYRGLYQYEQADASISEAIVLSRQSSGDLNADLPRYYAYQAEIRQNLLHFGGAEESSRAALRAARRMNEADHIDVMETEMNLGEILFVDSKPAEAFEHLRLAKELALKNFGPSEPFYIPQTYVALGFSLVQFGQLEEGLQNLEQAAAIRRRKRHDTVFMAQILHDQGYALVQLGRYAEAQALLDEAAEIRRKTNAAEDNISILARAKLLEVAGKQPEAAAFLETYSRSDAGVKGESIGVLSRWQARADAALYREDYQRALQAARELLAKFQVPSMRPFLKDRQSRAFLTEGRALLGLRRPQEAAASFKTAVALADETFDSMSPVHAELAVYLGECYRQLHDRRGARAQLLRARKVAAAHKQLGVQYTRPVKDLEASLNGTGGA